MVEGTNKLWEVKSKTSNPSLNPVAFFKVVAGAQQLDVFRDKGGAAFRVGDDMIKMEIFP